MSVTRYGSCPDLSIGGSIKPQPMEQEKLWGCMLCQRQLQKVWLNITNKNDILTDIDNSNRYKGVCNAILNNLII